MRRGTARDEDGNLGCFPETACFLFPLLNCPSGRPQRRLQLSGAGGAGVGGCGVPWDCTVVSQSSVGGSRTRCMFCNSAQAEYLAATSVVLWDPYKRSGLKKLRSQDGILLLPAGGLFFGFGFASLKCHWQKAKNEVLNLRI